MGPIADEPEIPAARAPDLRSHELLRPFDHDPGEVASRYARQDGERERASRVQHVAAVYGGGVDLDQNLVFPRLRPRDLRLPELRWIPEVFDQDGLHSAKHLHESFERIGVQAERFRGE